MTRSNATPRRLLLAICTAVFLAGCSASSVTTEAEHQATRNAIRRNLDRVRALVSRGQPSPAARLEVAEILRGLSMHPRPIVTGELVRSLRDSEDEFNSLVIRLLDDLDANDWVPVKVRARVATTETAVKLIGLGARRADQADAAIDRVRELCAADPNELTAAWLRLLESDPITAHRHDGSAVVVTQNVQGLALLGLIRTVGKANHGQILAKIKAKRVTAPPALLSQWIIHLSGNRLKLNLGLWLDGPSTAQAAALIAADLLRLRSPKLTGRLQPDRLNAAKAWVKSLPEDVTWSALTYGELRALVAQADEEKSKAGLATRLARARQLLGAPGQLSPFAWLKSLPGPGRIKGLERLVGIDILISPPSTP